MMPLSHRWMLLLIVLLAVSACGCVQRRLTVRTFPEGAVFYVDDQEGGVSPGSVGFTYYGTRKIVIEKDGYETEVLYERLDPPWYLIPPLDLFVENWPFGKIRDERVVDVELRPKQERPQAELIESAENLRTQVQQGQVIPLSESGPLHR